MLIVPPLLTAMPAGTVTAPAVKSSAVAARTNSAFRLPLIVTEPGLREVASVGKRTAAKIGSTS